MLKRFFVFLFVLSPSTMALAGLAQAPQSQIYGLDFSPYENGQNPGTGFQVTSAQILSRMQVVAPYTTWIRSFGSTGGLENTPSVARSLGLKVAANAWISSDLNQNTAEINNLIAAANAGQVDIAVVGSEAILRNDVTVSQLIGYMNQVRQNIPAGIPVVTADTWDTLIANPALIAASDQVWANFYPYWEGTSISAAMCSLEQEYQQLAQASGSKTLVVSETGLPSAGNPVGAAVASTANAVTFALQFFTWASMNNIPSFYFEAFNEDWKTASEGPQGANWGIWDENAVIKPGMDAFFNGQTDSVACNGIIPGPIAIKPTYIPPYGIPDIYGTTNVMEVQVTGVQPANYAIATYIDVNGGWWIKPYSSPPTVTINSDGTAAYHIDTGGSDYDATEIEAFLVNSNTTPPIVQGGGKPALANSGMFDIFRTPSSISGTVTDNQGNPISGALISDPVLGSTTSASDGRYSFYDITTTGTATLSVTYPNYVFSPSPATVAITSGNQVVSFTGTPTVDLSTAASGSPNPVSFGSSITATFLISNSGPASATDAILAFSVPASFTSVSVSSTRGSCNNAVQPVTCDLGGLPFTAYATVTLNAMTGSAGSYTLGACVSGPDPDSNPSNNCASQNFVVVTPTSSIIWATPAAITYGTTLSATQLNATSPVAGTFAYTPAAGTLLDAGTQTLSVTFTPTDMTDYNPATATVQLTVNKGTPAITWATPAAITYSTPLGASQLNASSGGVAGTFAYTPTSGTVLGAGSQKLSVAFTPTDTTDYNTPSPATATLTVNHATPTIAWNAPALVIVGTTLSATQLNAVASVPGTFAYFPASGTAMSTTGNIPLSATFTPTDSTDYNNATASVTLPVSNLATFSGTPISVNPGTTTGNTSTITLTLPNGFFGTLTLTLTCSITPATAIDPPTCSVPNSVTLSGTTSQTITLTVSSTAQIGMNERRQLIWPSAGGAVLACILLFGIPARRRSWRSMLGMLLLLIACTGGILACGGGSSGSSSGGSGSGGSGSASNPGTTPGNYSVTVTGTSGSVVVTSSPISFTVL